MKQLSFLLIFLVVLIGCSNSQISAPSLKLTGNIKKDVTALLPTGTVQASIMDSVLQHPRQIELTQKFQQAVKENYNWFLDFIKTVPEGAPLPYHPKLGLTQPEYTELMDYMNHTEIITSGKESVTIVRTNDMIHFKSKGKLAILDSVIIDLDSNVVLFMGYRLAFADTLEVTSEQNALKSAWSGYAWKFEEPKNLALDDLKDLRTLHIKAYQLTMGRLQKNGKTFMSLKGQEAQNGEKMIDFELPLIF